MAVDAEVNKEQGRPLFGVDGEVCSKKYLTGPTLLEMSGYRDLPGTCWFVSFVDLHLNRCDV